MAKSYDEQWTINRAKELGKTVEQYNAECVEQNKLAAAASGMTIAEYAKFLRKQGLGYSADLLVAS